MKKPNVLLITSKCPTDEISDSLSMPLGLHLIRHHLTKNGIDCDVFDHQLLSDQHCISNVEEGIYDIIGISVTHWNMANDLEFLYKLKKITKESGKNCIFIAGGLSATLNYSQWLECGFDIISLGYGEETMLNICKRFTTKQVGHIWELFSDLDGIAFHDERGRVVFNPAKPLSKLYFEQSMFNQMMEMDLPYNEYWEFMRNRATGILTMNQRSYVVENARLYTSSRCLANCGYCCCPAFIKTAQQSNPPFIMLSARQVIQLIIHHVQKYGARGFSFNDEDFLVGNKRGINRVLEICELIIESKQKGEIPQDTKFSCQTRADNFFIFDSNNKKSINHQLLKKMAHAKFHNVSIGIETFSERLKKCPSINKTRSTVNDNHALLHAMMGHDLYPTINLILAIPESTPDELIETIQKTMEYIDKPCQISVSNGMRAFPGAPIWDSKNYPTTDITWTNPVTKQTTYIPVYYTPRDMRMAALFDQLDNAVCRELSNLKAANNWDDSMLVPRIAISLCSFMAISRIMEESELLELIGNKLQQLINQNQK